LNGVAFGEFNDHAYSGRLDGRPREGARGIFTGPEWHEGAPTVGGGWGALMCSLSENISPSVRSQRPWSCLILIYMCNLPSK